ncbi:MAG TPA: DinB family protein [Flavisolibacter sp.]|nr:DinB family protein [Flavisolibacter sp.]
MPVDLSRVPSFYHGYINRVAERSLTAAFEVHPPQLVAFLKNIPEAKWDHRYAKGKWSIKEMVQHIIDAERIFCYRALCFAREDSTALPGFDENLYAETSKADRRQKNDLIEELESVQRSSKQLFNSFDEEQLGATGVANGKEIYDEGIGYIVIGHALHHQSILAERYLQ